MRRERSHVVASSDGEARMNIDEASVVASLQRMVRDSRDPYEPEFTRNFAWLLRNVGDLRLRIWSYLSECADRPLWRMDSPEGVHVETPHSGSFQPDMILDAGGHRFVCEHKVWSEDRRGQVRGYASACREPQCVTVMITVRERQWSQGARVKLLWSDIYHVVRDAHGNTAREYRRPLHVFATVVGRFRQPYGQLWPCGEHREGGRRFTRVRSHKIYIPEIDDILAALAPVPAFRPTNPNAPGAERVWENDLATPYHRVCAYAYTYGLREWTDALAELKPRIVEAWEKTDEIAK